VSVLRDFEKRLESAVEGIFAKAFRSGVQPVELAKRVLREMDDGRQVRTRGVTAPNRFVFRLGPEDYDRFRSAEESLAAELRQVVRDSAKERGWGLVGPPEIAFEEDDSIRKGQFRCDASLAEGDDPEAAARPAAELVLVSGGRASSKAFPISKPVTTIGRQTDCDVVLSDGAASRHHAELRNEGSAFTIQDLGSTNGTRVNGAAVMEQELQDGDRLTIGETELEFRAR
jgi:hypothetical protein